MYWREIAYAHFLCSEWKEWKFDYSAKQNANTKAMYWRIRQKISWCVKGDDSILTFCLWKNCRSKESIDGLKRDCHNEWSFKISSQTITKHKPLSLERTQWRYGRPGDFRWMVLYCDAGGLSEIQLLETSVQMLTSAATRQCGTMTQTWSTQRCSLRGSRLWTRCA